MIGLAVAGLAAAGLAAHGTWHRNSWVFGPTLTRLPDREGNVVSITFDDGPNPNATPLILDALREKNVKATFFVLGRHADRWPDLVRRMADEGHQLGNHGWYHRKLHRRTPGYVRTDLTRGTESIERASGVRPHHFRAPHGFRSPWVTPIAHSLGQQTVGWSLGVWDSARPGADEIVKRSLEGLSAGSILLLHDGDGYDEDGDRMQTAEALPRIIDGLRARGLGFVTLPD
jgi:peptidoglycan/xylan/chitin deacetylase (PgdA/CDA1 family)